MARIRVGQLGFDELAALEKKMLEDGGNLFWWRATASIRCGGGQRLQRR
jgi:hypothetical protein